ncbi:LOW QUALITY PROTEIN: hypothetical protein RJ641_008268 [Dillenia turbinata]|uniref:Glucose-methanol-choline oxidoreductase C-terminal domain-containing protein n=1 Tax=Dillenia turbinata TaxID=194707 RepID=A0AAN8Z4V0_9MAGN
MENQWKKQPPSRLMSRCSGGAVGTVEETGGIINEDEEGGPKNDDGFTRLLVRLLLPPGSEVSRRGARGVDVDRGAGVCKGGDAAGTKLAGREGKATVVEVTNQKVLLRKPHTLKKFTNEGSSGTSGALGGVDVAGSKGPSITAILNLLAKARYSLARFKGEHIVKLSQQMNIGYEDIGNQQAGYLPCLNVDMLILDLDALRIVDGSTFNISPGTNPHATLMMLGRGEETQNHDLPRRSNIFVWQSNVYLYSQNATRDKVENLLPFQSYKFPLLEVPNKTQISKGKVLLKKASLRLLRNDT